ncbi:ribonuclease P protein subunit p20 [Galendromus occidentalis]|uniref:Ribonuclease P protein subunit p20 n=1 Tax=Galendromus occidentalis TaxID=34638 RepID=A0AAJ6VYA8_9ACAR|nr:ribonuclease P protein subunit p20 [Galendromus occidentalis]
MASGSAVKPKADKLVRYDPSEYELRKRLPAQMPRSPDHVYINMRTDFQYQMLRAKEILFKGSNEVHIHGLGAAINRAINIALQIREHFGKAYEVDTQTNTIQVVDDFEPREEHIEPQSQTRNVSTIHIRVFKKD